MPNRTEGLSPLGFFNVLIAAIRAGEVLAKELREKEIIWRGELAPAHVEGVSVLMVIVSRHGSIASSVENYELLLKATYGTGGWIGKGYVGEQDPNVKMQGAGCLTSIPFAGTIYRGESHLEHNRISQKEMEDIIFGEAFHAGEYDQIHIIGHGDREGGTRGMLFWPVYNEERGWRRSAGFESDEAKKLIYPFCWPLKPGGKVFLIGCKVHLGGFKEFLEGIMGRGNVYAAEEEEWKCNYGWVEKRDERFGALDWFHPGQDPSTRHIGEWLGLKAGREYK